MENETSTFTNSRDGKVYKTVKIGSQVWMAENLNYDAGEGCWYYDDDPGNGEKYGKLYDWETAKTVCPSANGWHLPTEAEFEALLNNFGDSEEEAYNTLISSGSSGFSASFGGWRGYSGSYYGIGVNGLFWSSSAIDDTGAWRLYMWSGTKEAYMNFDIRSIGLSIRCVQDN